MLGICKNKVAENRSVSWGPRAIASECGSPHRPKCLMAPTQCTCSGCTMSTVSYHIYYLCCIVVYLAQHVIEFVTNQTRLLTRIVAWRTEQCFYDCYIMQERIMMYFRTSGWSKPWINSRVQCWIGLCCRSPTIWFGRLRHWKTKLYWIFSN